MGFLDSLKEKIIGESVEEEIEEGLYPIDEEGEGEVEDVAEITLIEYLYGEIGLV